MGYLGVVAVAWLSFYEQPLVREAYLTRLDVALFTMDGNVGLIFFLFVLLERVIG